MKKFTESIKELSDSSVDDYKNELSTHAKDLLVILDKINHIKNNISMYKSDNTTNNDQIDNSVINLDIIINNINESISKVDEIITDFDSYKADGRKYIY